MPGFREAGVVGVGLALTGGLGYIIWTYLSTSNEKGKGSTPEQGKTESGDGNTLKRNPIRETTEQGERDSEKETEREEDVETSAATEAVTVETVKLPVEEPTLLETLELEAEIQFEARVALDQTAPPAESIQDETVPVVELEAQNVSLNETKPAEKGKQVLVLGLDGAGKTSLLQYFATGSLEQEVVPTQGFNAVSINREDLSIEFLEIGGTENLREYWIKYLPKAMVLVFVLDSSKADQFTLAKEHLHKLIASDSQLPLVVLANKQDLPEASSITEIHDALALGDVGERRLFLIGTHVMKGDQEVNTGLQDTWDLIIQMVCFGR